MSCGLCSLSVTLESYRGKRENEINERPDLCLASLVAGWEPAVLLLPVSWRHIDFFFFFFCDSAFKHG